MFPEIWTGKLELVPWWWGPFSDHHDGSFNVVERGIAYFLGKENKADETDMKEMMIRECPNQLGSSVAFRFRESVVLSKTWWHFLPLNSVLGSPSILFCCDNAQFTEVHSVKYTQASPE